MVFQAFLCILTFSNNDYDFEIHLFTLRTTDGLTQLLQKVQTVNDAPEGKTLKIFLFRLNIIFFPSHLVQILNILQILQGVCKLWNETVFIHVFLILYYSPRDVFSSLLVLVCLCVCFMTMLQFHHWWEEMYWQQGVSRRSGQWCRVMAISHACQQLHSAQNDV